MRGHEIYSFRTRKRHDTKVDQLLLFHKRQVEQRRVPHDCPNKSSPEEIHMVLFRRIYWIVIRSNIICSLCGKWSSDICSELNWLGQSFWSKTKKNKVAVFSALRIDPVLKRQFHNCRNCFGTVFSSSSVSVPFPIDPIVPAVTILCAPQ